MFLKKQDVRIWVCRWNDESSALAMKDSRVSYDYSEMTSDTLAAREGFTATYLAVTSQIIHLVQSFFVDSHVLFYFRSYNRRIKVKLPMKLVLIWGL